MVLFWLPHLVSLTWNRIFGMMWSYAPFFPVSISSCPESSLPCICCTLFFINWPFIYVGFVPCFTYLFTYFCSNTTLCVCVCVIYICLEQGWANCRQWVKFMWWYTNWQLHFGNLSKIRTTWTQALWYCDNLRAERATVWLKERWQYSVETLDKGKIPTQVPWSRTVWDFIMLLRMVLNLKHIYFFTSRSFYSIFPDQLTMGNWS